MLVRSFCLVIFTVILLATCVDQASAQLPPPPENKNLVVRRVGPPPPIDYTLKVFHDKKKVPINQAKLYQAAQDILNQCRLEATEERWRYFRFVIGPTGAPVIGWGGRLDSITQAEEGVIVTICIYADRPMIIDTACIIESYSIIDGEVSYLGAFVPPNQQRIQIKP